MSRNEVENTARTAQENPLIALVDTMGPRGIERQEKRGQEQLVRSSVLPVDTNGSDPEFEALGFTFGAVVDGDPLFRQATLPAGWTRRPCEHDMWSHIIDERGIERVNIFYKAAFYDRSAHMRMNNVGRDLGNRAIYGTEPVTAEALKLALLTAAEREELVAALRDFRVNLDKYPSIYGKYAERLVACEVLARSPHT